MVPGNIWCSYHTASTSDVVILKAPWNTKLGHAKRKRTPISHWGKRPENFAQWMKPVVKMEQRCFSTYFVFSTVLSLFQTRDLPRSLLPWFTQCTSLQKLLSYLLYKWFHNGVILPESLLWWCCGHWNITISRGPGFDPRARQENEVPMNTLVCSCGLFVELLSSFRSLSGETLALASHPRMGQSHTHTRDFNTLIICHSRHATHK